MSEAPTFEDALRRLEEIVRLLESPDLPLEQGLALYREGSQCSRLCREKLEAAKHELQIWRDGEAESIDEKDLGEGK